jgi:hypothetical protein
MNKTDLSLGVKRSPSGLGNGRAPSAGAVLATVPCTYCLAPIHGGSFSYVSTVRAANPSVHQRNTN